MAIDAAVKAMMFVLVLYVCAAVIMGAYLTISHLFGAALFGLFLFLGALYELSHPDNARLRGRRPGARTRVFRTVEGQAGQPTQVQPSNAHRSGAERS